jgi:heme-binding protein
LWRYFALGNTRSGLRVLNDVRTEFATLYQERAKLGKRILLGLIVVGIAWVSASVFVHVVPHTVSERATAPLLQGAGIAPSAISVFNRSCVNCHSEKTQWPWYSKVAPGFWLTERDVKYARARMNLSRWDSLQPADQRVLLTAIGTVIENREMPPRRYLLLHPDAILTADEAVVVIEWTRAERRRLREMASSRNPE